VEAIVPGGGMIYLLRIPKINEYPLTPLECERLDIEWVEGETNYELVLISCEGGKLRETIEDTLGVVSARRTDDKHWVISGYDEVMVVANNTLDLVFREDREIEIIVEPMTTLKDLEKFFKSGSSIHRIFQYCF